ncbi:ABC transporter [Halopseudomonas oceani]|jgi:polar amino acid transport system substrate-binding protein|uniref:ABC transporter n=1 Tax=Halopseudomonas oceani TaxID=1708783 RepID=A0A2P4EVT5_9GAMM|nr:transporter substrate-binding domain-containing protein [Halopseudomonas oceani]POB03721.1 ABC transporter [Halopseudomonas oceani]GGE47139.1 ABC transporter [Halopseudomonas oceani]
MTSDADVSEFTQAYAPHRSRSRHRALFGVALIALHSLFCNPLAAIELSSLEWPPYSGADLPGQGSLSELLRRALASQDTPLLIHFQPWSRAIRSATTEPDIVGYFPRYFADDQLCLYSDSIGTSRVGLATRSDLSVSWDQLEDLRTYRIGVVRGYRNVPEFDALVADGTLKVKEAANDQLNLLKLVYGRLDLAVIDEQVMQHWLSHEPLLRQNADKLTFAKQLLGEPTMHVCFIPGEAGEQARLLLNQGLQQIQHYQASGSGNAGR